MKALRNTPSPRGEGAGGGVMRRCESAAEERAWQALRQLRHEGVHVMRQLKVGRYRVDFAVRKARLAIEIDGDLHKQPERAEYDRQRQTHLERLRWRFIRIPANATHDSLLVLNAVRAVVFPEHRASPHPSTPSPHGEGRRPPYA